MPGTIDEAVIRKDDDEIERAAKNEQDKAEARRERIKREGPKEQAPGELPPEPLE